MRILVIDSDPEVLSLCERTLSKAGFEVHAVNGKNKAQECLDRNWDMALADSALAEQSEGMDMLRRLRVEGGSDILLMAARPNPGLAGGAGAYDCVAKPLVTDELLTAVNRCADRRRVFQELKRERALRAQLEQTCLELTRMQKLQDRFGQFVAPELAQYMLDKDHAQAIWRGERKTVSILFADVRRFTPYTSSVPPEEVVEALNDIFACIIAAVRWEGGMLNKFIGDGMLALFGAPLPNEDHALCAARAALRARMGVEFMAEERKKSGLHPLRIGIGINTGEVVAGCLGTKEHAEYSVIGHAANIAARLEEMAGMGEILVGPETARLITPHFELQDKGFLMLPGISEPTAVTELIGNKTDAPSSPDKKPQTKISLRLRERDFRPKKP